METTITADQVEQTIVDSLVTFGAEPADINRGATFEDLEVDSLDLAELSQIVEEKFGVEMKSSDVAEIKTVGDAIDLVLARA
jgi:acyl carrier protein